MVYAVYCVNNEMRSRSSSGGVYPILAEHIINKSGVVYASAYDGIAVKYISVEIREEIQKTQGAKYAPSTLGDTFRRVRETLEHGKEVLFVGLPCHCAGLKNFLQKTYDNLLVIAIVCHGVPSQKALESYAIKRSIKMINMRDKSNGWTNYNWKLIRENHEENVPYKEVSFMKGFVHDLYLRPCCYECQFKNGTDNLSADLVLGDFWGIQYIRPELFSDQGVSIVITNTERGQKVLQQIQDKISIHVVEGDSYKNYNKGFSIATKTKNRDRFFEGLKQGKDFDELVNTLLRPSLANRVTQTTKRIIMRAIGR